MAKKTYFVTEAAGRLVAGARSPGAGKPIELSDAQAEHPLRLGHIAEALPEPVVENATAGTILRWFTIVYMLIELHEPRFKLVRFLVDSVLRDGGATFTMEGQYRPFALNGFVQAKLFLSVVGNAVRIRSAV